MTKSSPLNRGFTLIELMVVVSILAIMAAIATPSIRQMVEANAVSNEVNSLIGSLQLARSEAIKHSANAVVCRTDSAGAPACASSGDDWSTGWIVFVDRNADDDFNADKDQLISVTEPVRGIGAIKNNIKKINFNRTGTIGGAFSKFVFTSKSGDEKLTTVVCLSLSGRARVVKNPKGECST